MTNAEIESALNYNRRHGYSTAQVKTIQEVVGSKPDGAMGPNTIKAISNWQSENGLKPDGKVGPLTYEEMVNSLETCEPGEPQHPEIVTRVGCGLAAYDCTFPGLPGGESMAIAAQAAIDAGAEELRWWSTEWLLDDIAGDELGGAKGAPYGEPFLRSFDFPEGIRLGAWIDEAIRIVKKAAYGRRLRDMGLTSGAVMINKSNTRHSNAPWALRAGEDDMKRVADILHAADIERIATTWPRPSKAMIDMMLEDMAWILRVLGAVAFEVDTEGNWMPTFLDGFPNMRAAAEYLAAGMRRVIAEAGLAGKCRTELTTYTYHTENSSKAKLAPLVDFLLPQGYAVHERQENGKPIFIGVNDTLGPHKHPGFAMRRARQAAAA